MNYVDIILLLIMALAVWGGWRKGFILGTVNLIVWIGSLLLGFLFYQYLGNLIQGYFPTLGVWTLPLAFLITLIVSRILLAFFFNTILSRTPETIHSHGANKFLGIIPGIINGVIYATILAAILMSVPLMNNLSKKTRESRLGTGNFFS
ncbi:MAG: CvpA family protein, partial [Flavisolibacter sp.]